MLSFTTPTPAATSPSWQPPVLWSCAAASDTADPNDQRTDRPARSVVMQWNRLACANRRYARSRCLVPADGCSRRSGCSAALPAEDLSVDGFFGCDGARGWLPWLLGAAGLAVDVSLC